MVNRRSTGKVVELKAQGARARLREAAEQRTLVRLWRSGLEAGSFTGYVVAVGREFFLLWTVGDYIGYDGLYALRHRDITELEAPDASHAFIEKAMVLKQVVPEFPAAWDLDSAEGVVRSACAMRAVIAVHVDTEGPSEICFVGRLLDHEPEGFMMQEITPDAEWLREGSFFGYEEISAVAVASPYNDALEMVAGQPPDDVQPARDQGAKQ